MPQDENCRRFEPQDFDDEWWSTVMNETDYQVLACAVRRKQTQQEHSPHTACLHSMFVFHTAIKFCCMTGVMRLVFHRNLSLPILASQFRAATWTMKACASWSKTAARGPVTPLLNCSIIGSKSTARSYVILAFKVFYNDALRLCERAIGTLAYASYFRM